MRLFTKIAERYRAYMKYRRTLAELDMMSDRELSELNISRYMIREVASGRYVP